MTMEDKHKLKKQGVVDIVSNYHRDYKHDLHNINIINYLFFAEVWERNRLILSANMHQKMKYGRESNVSV